MTTQTATKKAELSFSQWMTRVDAIIECMTSFSADDLSDYCYRDAYEDGLSPAKAAQRAVRAAME